MNRIELALRRKALLDEGAKVLKEDRKALDAQLTAGERHGDPAYGFATMSNPQPVATIVDAEELDHFLYLEGQFIADDTITDYKAAVKVLREYAPELVVRREVVPQYARDAALSRAKAGEAIPGVAVRDGLPSLSLRPSPAVRAWAVEAMTTGLPEVE